MKQSAYESEMTVSYLVETVLIDFIRGDLAYDDDHDDALDAGDRDLSHRAERAASELESILSDADALELDDQSFREFPIEQASEGLTALAESVREWQESEPDLDDDEEEEEDED